MQVGFKALQDRYGVELVQPLRVESTIGPTRLRKESPTGVSSRYPPSYAPQDDFSGHFEFGLKYEEIHLEFLSRLFAASGPAPLEEWCGMEPSGQYARRAGFLYEWLTGERLAVPDLTKGNYVPALAPQDYLTRTVPIRDRRWRVADNLPGTARFCPIVRRTSALREALGFDPSQALADLDRRFGAEILLGSSGWLTLKESRASFLIEHEEDRSDRVARFASVIAEHCGRIDEPLGESSLMILQEGVLGANAAGLGIRRSPVFVGQATLREDVVHYVAPRFEDVPGMLAGLREVEESTRGMESILRAAVLSFGFVYIHPLRDGNGRIHRILVNDTLVRDHCIPDAVILPVSASITHSVRFRADYERTLEVFSRPFLRRFGSRCRFGEMTTAPDGTRTNFHFDAYDEAGPAWRHPDLTEHAIYVARLIEHTILTQMADEAKILLSFRIALERMKDVVEIPDPQANRIIRSLKENGWKVSGSLRKEHDWLDDAVIRERIVEAVRSAFEVDAVGSG